MSREEHNAQSIPILLIDDQVITGHMVERALQSAEEFSLHHVMSPEKVLETARKIKPMAVLLDLVMPDINGIDILKMLRKLPETRMTPIIMLSSQEQSEHKVEAFALGANDYIVKLPDALELIARLRYHVNRYQSLQQLHESQKRIRQNEARLNAIIQSVREAIVVVNNRGDISLWNPGAEEMFLTPAAKARNMPLKSFFADQDWDLYQEAITLMRQCARETVSDTATGERTALQDRTLEMTALKSDGTTFAVELSLSFWSLESKENDLSGQSLVIRDITERKKREEKVYRQANYDALTNLPNRNMFLRELDHQVKMAQRTGDRLALMFIDLDHFKWVNDTLGHAAGDALLVETASRLKSSVRRSDIVGRLAGDEFTVLLTLLKSSQDARLIAKKILKALNTPFDLEGETANISGSIGITLFPEDGTEREALLRNADQAMYVSKQKGRNDFWFFSPELNSVEND